LCLLKSRFMDRLSRPAFEAGKPDGGLKADNGRKLEGSGFLHLVDNHGCVFFLEKDGEDGG